MSNKSSIDESREEKETNANELNHDNAWTLSSSPVDTLSSMLDRNTRFRSRSPINFELAGDSLEAACKVYSLRVDSLHQDAKRLASVVNAKQGNADEDEDEDTNGEANSSPLSKKRECKNRPTLNAKLDTEPLPDPFFAKLNLLLVSNNRRDGPEATDMELFDDEHFKTDPSDAPAPAVAAKDVVLEIPTEFEGAPAQPSKVVVPFAKCAKSINMKKLKKSCDFLIQKQLQTIAEVPESAIPAHPTAKPEKYAEGVASFKKVYEQLPNLLTPSAAQSVSPAVAFASVLQLASDKKLRLIQQEDMKDFKIRKILD